MCLRLHHKNIAKIAPCRKILLYGTMQRLTYQTWYQIMHEYLFSVSYNNTCIIMWFPFHTLVMGPVAELGDLVLQEADELPEWELPLGLLETNGLMDWLTPCARMNCSRSSTLVRPLAERIKTSHGLFHSTSNKSEVNYEKKFRKTRTSTEST